MSSEIIRNAGAKMTKAVDALEGEFGKLRTGRATVTVFDGIMVDYYGTMTPINQVATLAVPEPRLITIQPWDVSQIALIEKAIVTADIGLNPSNDGKVIRISIPSLTEERRKDIVKVARRYAEEGKVSVRNARREANDSLKALEKDSEITQDDLKKFQKDVQDLTDKEVARIEKILDSKEQEIMEI